MFYKMCDNFEFNDDDDILLASICTTTLTREDTTPITRLNEETDDKNDALKKPRLECPNNLSPEFLSLRRNPPNAVKRIFPGPAGILTDENQMEVCSQRTSSIFHDGPWAEMSKDFEISNVPELYDKFSIAWLKREAAKSQFANQKAPFLAAVLMSLDVSDGHTQKSVNVTMKDTTGTIQGNILYSLYEEYANHFILGSILVLVQFGVLSCTCDKCDNYHLTITPKNLSVIYNEKTKIVINKIEPEQVLSCFLKQQKELELRTIDQALMKQNTPNTSPIGGSCSVNKRNRFQTSYSNTGINSCNIRNQLNSPYKVPYKNKSEDFLLPKFSNIFRASTEDRQETGTHRKKALFTFKKVPLSKVTDSSQNVSHTLNISKNYFVNNDTSLSIQQNNHNDSLERKLPPEIDMDVIHNNVSNISKKQFNFKKIPTQTSSLTSESTNPNDLSKSNTNCSSNNERCSIKIGSSQVSVKVNNVEHEKLWKDVLDDVDINSLFDDDF